MRLLRLLRRRLLATDDVVLILDDRQRFCPCFDLQSRDFLFYG